MSGEMHAVHPTRKVTSADNIALLEERRVAALTPVERLIMANLRLVDIGEKLVWLFFLIQFTQLFLVGIMLYGFWERRP